MTRLLTDKTNVAILLLLRTQPLHCRKLSLMLGKGETQIARRLSLLERAGLLGSEWVHKGRNIKVYFLKVDRIRLQITDEGIHAIYGLEKKKASFALESIFTFDIPVVDTFVDREYQLTVLDQALFIVLTGIAGIGKTSLASFYAQQLKDKGKKVFWHTFSELDSVLFVVKKLAIFLAKYNYPQLLDYIKADSADMRVVEALLKECMADPAFAFFFDDYHVVMSESMHQLFAQLKTCDGKICVVSRYKPPFVSVFDNTVEVRLGEMDAHAVKTLLERKGVNLHREPLQQVSERIGGHPLALELLCQAANERDPASLLKELPSLEIGAYLWDEIYSCLTPEEQQLLITVSIFRTPVDIAAVESMCPLANVRTVMKQLTRKNLLKRVDGKYTHHSVTRMFCLTLAPNKKVLHYKAAESYLHLETSKDIMEALHHFLEAGAYEKAAEVIMTWYHLLINDGYADQLLSFLKKVKNVPVYNKQLLEVEGEIYTLKGEYDAAITCFTTCKESAATPSLYRKLGEVYIKKREYKTAEALFLQGLSMVTTDPTERGDILVQLAEVHSELGESEKALSCCEKALTCFSESEYKKGIAHVYIQMGKILRYSNTDKALELLSSSLEISQNIGDVQEVAATYITMGTVLYERGRTAEALTYFKKGLEISEKIGDMTGVSQCCNNIGATYTLEWKWPQAMKYYQRALSICEKINDKKRIAFLYTNFGHIYSRLGLWEKALNYYFTGLKLSEALSDKREIAFLYYKIGAAYLEMGAFHKALSWIEKSLTIRQRVEHTLGVAYCCASLGKLYGERGEFDTAMTYLEKALAIHEREKGAWMAACTTVFCAQVLVYKNEFDRAVQMAEKTIQTLEAVGDIQSLVQAHQVLAEAHLGAGRFDKAVLHAEASLQQACSMNSSRFEGRARRVLGVVLMGKEEYDRAEEELQFSMRLLKRFPFELAKTYMQVAFLSEKKGLPETCAAFLWKAQILFKDVGAHSYERRCREYGEHVQSR